MDLTALPSALITGLITGVIALSGVIYTHARRHSGRKRVGNAKMLGALKIDSGSGKSGREITVEMRTWRSWQNSVVSTTG